MYKAPQWTLKHIVQMRAQSQYAPNALIPKIRLSSTSIHTKVGEALPTPQLFAARIPRAATGGSVRAASRSVGWACRRPATARDLNQNPLGNRKSKGYPIVSAGPKLLYRVEELVHRWPRVSTRTARNSRPDHATSMTARAASYSTTQHVTRRYPRVDCIRMWSGSFNWGM